MPLRLRGSPHFSARIHSFSEDAIDARADDWRGSRRANSARPRRDVKSTAAKTRSGWPLRAALAMVTPRPAFSSIWPTRNSATTVPITAKPAATRNPANTLGNAAGSAASQHVAAAGAVQAKQIDQRGIGREHAAQRVGDDWKHRHDERRRSRRLAILRQTRRSAGGRCDDGDGLEENGVRIKRPPGEGGGRQGDRRNDTEDRAGGEADEGGLRGRPTGAG